MVRLTYDNGGRRTRVTLAGAVVNTVTYDGDGKRRSYGDSAGFRKFIWDGENILLGADVNNVTEAMYALAPMVHGELQVRCAAACAHMGHPRTPAIWSRHGYGASSPGKGRCLTKGEGR